MFKVYFLEEGTHTDSKGSVDEYTRKDLEEIRDNYDPSLFESPIVIGHDDDISTLYTQKDSIPAYGWVKKLGVDNKGLYAVADLSPELENLVVRDVPAYKHISGAIYNIDSPSNPKKGEARYLRHIAFLGGSPPAIKGLPKAVKLYREQLPIEHSLINYIGNLEFMESMTDKEYNETVTMPPVDAPIEVIEGFLGNNAEDFLVYVLTDGEYGYPGEITRFEPEVTKENKYLYDPETGKFSGVFFDDYSTEEYGYEFEIGKRNGQWYTSYSPVNKEEQGVEEQEIEEFSEGVPEVLPSLNQSEESLMASEAELTDDEEESLADGTLPEVEEEEEEEQEEAREQRLQNDLLAEIELMREESKSLRNEVLRLKTEINDMKMDDFKNYTETKKDLLASLGLNGNDLLSIFSTLVSAPDTLTYKEGVKSPLSTLMTLIDSFEEKLTKANLATYGEFEPDCEDDEEDLAYLGENEPKDAVADEDSVKLHKDIVKYCKDNNLDVTKPNHYKEAYKAVVTGYKGKV